METKTITGWKGHDAALKALDKQEDDAAEKGIIGSEESKPERRRWKKKLERGELKHEIDIARRNAAAMLLLKYAKRSKFDVPVHWVWMSETGAEYELRQGNPPSDQDRPRHLQGLDLWVDVGQIPFGLMKAVQTLSQRSGSMDMFDVGRRENARRIFEKQMEDIANDCH